MSLNKLYRKARADAHFFVSHKLLKRPYFWTDYPTVVQIDTTNHCGKKYCDVICEYCQPQWKIAQGDWKYGEMSMEMIEWILRDIGKYGKNMTYIMMFLNGDGLTDLRYPEILGYAKRVAPSVPTQTFTCGTLTENAYLLCDKNLDKVSFTVSASNRELYRQVHRGDKFDAVIETMKYVTENRKPNQQLEVHYVITEKNFPYMRDWWQFMGSNFPEWKRVFSPLVASFDNFPSKRALGNLTTEMQEREIAKFVGSAFWRREAVSWRQPCVLWNNASITCDGTILQCCNWCDPVWNYGNVKDYMRNGLSLRDYWMMKIANKQNNVLCESCNLRHPDWKKRLENIRVSAKISK